MTDYWLNQGIKIFIIYLSSYLLGVWVIKRGVRVNYTRKICHFILFFFPLALGSYIPFQSSRLTSIISGLIFVACTLSLSKPFRSRFAFFATAFASIDRPEDRPFTLLWTTTQVVATYAVLFLVVFWLKQYEKAALIYVTVLVAGIGDGLAEPVGIRFGRHKYLTRALFTDRIYSRSLEGSACVLLSGIFAIVLVREHFTSQQFLLALLFIPPVMALAEAFSPHTWDGPFLYLAGGASTIGVLELSKFI